MFYNAIINQKDERNHLQNCQDTQNFKLPDKVNATMSKLGGLESGNGKIKVFANTDFKQLRHTHKFFGNKLDFTPSYKYFTPKDVAKKQAAKGLPGAQHYKKRR